MSVVIRFNTVIVRKARIEAAYPGGLDQYRRDFASQSNDYYEDANLTVRTSMSGFYGDWDRLMESGLIHEKDDTVVDIVTADQSNGVDPRCDWLESIECCGIPVCWLKEKDPRYIVDCKPRRFMKRVPQSACPECFNLFTIASAAQAVDIQEHRSGPLIIVRENPMDYGRTQFMVSCSHCGHETEFDDIGRQGPKKGI